MNKVLIAIPSYEGKIITDLLCFLDGMILPQGRSYGRAYVTRTPIHMARNMILEKMIEGGYDGVIMCDDDQIPTERDCFKRMIEIGKDMVSGVVRLRHKQEHLNVLYSKPYESESNRGMKQYINHKKIQTTKPFRIDNAGTGLVYLSRRACEAMIKAYNGQPFENMNIVYVLQNDGSWVEFGIQNKEPKMMEDGTFKLCRRLLSEDYLFFERAISQGFELRCEPNARCIHLGNPERIMV